MFGKEDNKERDHDQVTGKHWGFCLAKKVSVIFHNLRVYASSLIMQEIGKFNIKINVILKELKKMHAFHN